MLKVRISIITIMVVMLFTSLFPVAPVSAQAEDRSISYVPVLQSPRGTVLVTMPTYKWTRVSGATKYQFQLNMGTSMILDRYPGSAACVSTTCSVKPATTLGYNVYKWRVRAFSGGSWKPWSAYKFFTVSAPPFYSYFNGSTSEGWARKLGGTWDLTGMYYHTEGLPNQFTGAYFTAGQYTDFDYTAQVWRYGNDPSYLAVRMGSSVGGTQEIWYPGYLFGYSNLGNFYVRRFNSSGVETLTNISTNGAINKNTWNTLRVRAVGNQFWFYINGTLVYNFTDTSTDKRSRGYVGVLTYRNTTSPTYAFYMNYASLEAIITP